MRDAHAYVIHLTANRAQRALFPNPHRVSAIIFNNSAADVYLGFHSFVRTAGSLRGITIRAGGGTWNTGEPKVYTGEVWLISASSVDVDVVEEVELPESEGHTKKGEGE